MSDFEEFNKSVGIKTPLNDFLQTLKKEKRNYVDIKNVKTFLVPAIGGGYGVKDHEMKDIATLLIVQYSHWAPTCGGSTWGTSGYSENKIPQWNGGTSTSQYLLSVKEMREVVKKHPNLTETTRFKAEKWMTTDSNGKNVRSKPYKYGFEHRSDCNMKEYYKCMDEFRALSEEKYKKLSGPKIFEFFVNGVKFEYTSYIEININCTTQDLSYSFYFYDKDGNYIDSWGGHGAIYG